MLYSVTALVKNLQKNYKRQEPPQKGKLLLIKVKLLVN